MLKPGTLALTAALALLTSLGPLSTDMYLPSLPAIAARFAVGPGEVQYTLSAYLVGFAAGQVGYGPWSDRIGRKPVILLGLAIYALGSAAAAAAPGLAVLIAARALQGFGAAGPLVLARAVVRDLYEGREAARQLSRMGTIMGLVPALAPLLGAGLELAFGWRSNFVVALLFAIALMALVKFAFPETLPARTGERFALSALLGDFAALLRDGRFLPYALICAFAYCGLFAFISTSSFVLQQQYGLDTVQFALSFGLVVIGFIAGTVLAQSSVRLHGIDRTILAGAGLVLAGGGSMLVLMLAHGGHALEVAIPMAVYTCGVGFLMPQSAAASIMPFPERAGTASALLGILQMSLAAGFGILAGQAIESTALALPAAVFLMGIGAAVLAVRINRRRRSEQP